MTHNIDVIITLIGGLSIALVFGLISKYLKLSPIVGYIFAGILVNFIPNLHIDYDTAAQFAEIGVILLMFSVGLNSHIKDLIAVKNVAIPGAISQIVITTITSMFLAHFFGWDYKAGLVFGISISVASTVVLMRVLSDNRVLHTKIGHTAVGWLVVEDLFTILVLVLLPAIFSPDISNANILPIFGVTILKLIFLTVFTLIVGGKLIPYFLTFISKTGSRDLFTLSILTLAIGIAFGSAHFFDASMALGAFLAGIVVGKSVFSSRAASEVLPIKDIFAVLFFVSVGMLLDINELKNSWQLMFLTLFIILIIKPLIAFLVVLLLKKPLKQAISIGIALAQTGEFSFILASMGTSLNILPQEAYSAIIASSIISITLNPILYKAINPFVKFLNKKGININSVQNNNEEGVLKININNEINEQDYVIIVGYGPVGQAVTKILNDKGISVNIIELNIDTVKKIKDKNSNCLNALYGDAMQREVLIKAGINNALAFIISSTLASSKEIIEIVKSINPNVQILVNTSYINDIEALKAKGANIVFSGELAVSQILSNYIFNEFGLLCNEIECGCNKQNNQNEEGNNKDILQ